MACPEEMTLEMLVVGGEGAFCELFDFGVSEVFRVGGALSIHYVVIFGGFIATTAVWAEDGGVSVKVDSFRGHVRHWAIDTLAFELRDAIALVEATEPVGAEVRAERPLTNPNIVLDFVSLSRIGFVLIAELVDIAHILVPGLIIVMV